MSTFSLSAASGLFKAFYGRKYTIYEVWFIKHRQRQLTTFRRKREALKLFKEYQRKYKSASYYENLPFSKMLSSENSVLDMIKKNSDFAGAEVKIPVSFSGRLKAKDIK